MPALVPKSVAYPPTKYCVPKFGRYDALGDSRIHSADERFAERPDWTVENDVCFVVSLSVRFGWAVVLGDPGYYSRFGFVAARRFGLVDEYGGDDAFQVAELADGSVPVGAGLVRYGPEFASLV
jgi:hypothetical protein